MTGVLGDRLSELDQTMVFVHLIAYYEPTEDVTSDSQTHVSSEQEQKRLGGLKSCSDCASPVAALLKEPG